MSVHVIGVTGMPGSGKTVFARFATDFGYKSVVMGDMVRKEVRRRGMDPTPQACRDTMIDMRKIDGDAAVAKITSKEISKLIQSGEKKIIIDGIRSQHEVKEFENEFGNSFNIIAIHVDPKIRFKRLKERGRRDAPQDMKEFDERDFVELNLGVGETIAFANFVIPNNDSVEQFKVKSISLLEEIEKEN